MTNTKSVLNFIIIIALIVGNFQNSFAQISNNKSYLTDCYQEFYDTGGSTGDYENDENYTVTFCPEDGADTIMMIFNSFDLSTEGWDFIYIFDGDNMDNFIGEYTGTNSPGTITSTIENGGCLTIFFSSDGAGTSAGWSAQIFCGDSPSCSIPTVIVDDVTDNSVFLYIEETNSPPATTWKIEYGLPGFIQGSGTTITTSSDYTEVTGLASGTSYDAYIRSICDVDNMSWASKVTFITTGVLSNDTYNVKPFSISPNPVEDILTIKLKDFETGIIKIYNLEESLIQTKKNNATITKLNVSNLTNGIYFVKIETKNQSFIKKFIKL